MAKRIVNSKSRIKTNRQYKSSVFASYFSETNQRLIEIYNAFSNVAYPADTPIEVNTIDNALFYGLVNDVSFVLDNVLVVLIEHQSTWNPNMPFRILLYIVEILKRIYHDPKPFYKSTLQEIDKIRCFVLYNGNDEKPDVTKLRLSDAFKKVADVIDDPELDTQLELVIPVYNINAGRNPEILAKSKSLQDYTLFTAKVNEAKATGKDLTQAVETAIKYCIGHNIMADYLKTHGTEVRSVLFADITVEEIGEVRFEEGLEIGEARGRVEGRAEGRTEGRTEGKIDQAIKMATKLIKRNDPDDLIADLTELPISEIKRLRGLYA
ncbi:hypothetical protein AGMMS49992_03330 [Clostridia bacterium]|nr:hypothetical protein AGMMS49992_03330 [Clostridia bacterium]